jgi:hypothetical protein
VASALHARDASPMAAPADVAVVPRETTVSVAARTAPPASTSAPAATVAASGGNGHHVGSAPSPAAPATVDLSPRVTASQPAPAVQVTAARSDLAAAGAAVPLTEVEVLTRLVRIVSDRTGYPEEMLSVDANMEADLGIDSIKRMEILATFQETHGGSERGSFQQALERLTALKTLRESAAALTDVLSAPLAAAL